VRATSAGQACEAPIAEYADVPAGTIFGLGDKEKGPVSCPPELECGPHFEGASSDGADVVIDSREPLTQEAAGSVGAQLYEWSASSAPAGRLTLVSILPPTTEEEAKGEHGRPPMSAALGEPDEGVVRDTVSADGSRVVWQVPGGGHLYLRDVALRQTVQLDAVREGKGQGKAEPMYQAASVDGSRIYFTDKQRLTGNAGGEGEAFREGDLYECEVVVSPGGKLDCKLTDLTPESASGEHARVQGLVIGTSKDGSYVYFVADGVLSDHGAPVAGAQPGGCHSGASAGALCNLYVWHEGTLGLVARISMEDAPDWNPDGGHGLAEVAAGLSPDGRWLAFMSDRSLTGYDMRDLRLGVADEEVFAYHAPADLATEAGRISCLSCNPTGARPVGKEFDQMIPGIDGETGMWAPSRVLAGSLPGWESYNSGNPPATLHKPRLVSDNGRVFFNANDALVSADVNATGDVYEWEPGGVPSGAHACSTSSTTASDVYKPAHTVEVEGRTVVEGAGCVALISSGTSSDESIFLDASATGGRSEEDGEGVEGGGDVFFFTTSKLVKEDTDDSRDVYDAHECTSESPCLPEAAETPAPCESADACKPAPSPQPSIFGAGPTETFKGPGNIAPPPAGKPKVETRAEKLKAALASCKHKYPHSKKKRSTCEKKARKAYAAKHAAKKSSRKKH